ncbi:MAG: hypothetical protein ABIN89_18765 [Chitinophagaceae bacterium]
MKKLLRMSLYIALPAILLSANGCKKHHDPPTLPPVEVDIEIRISNSPTLGSYLSDKSGHAVYMFANDANGLNNCAGNCELTWPYFFVDSLNNDKLGDTSLHLSDFKTIMAANGKKQTTFKGWPLYYHAPSVGGVNTPDVAGVTTGDGVGGIWFIAKPDYTIMLANLQLTGNNGKTYLSDYTEGTGRTVYFTDGKGVTLYAFRNDKLNTNTFTRADFSNNGTWPINENLKVVAPSVLDKTLFGSIEVFTRKQLTYKGRPVYNFGLDSMMRGKNKGVSAGSLPGTWPVVVKDIAPATP